jgi:CubicO group peptidase (beta-lactamase class C family)
MTFASIWAVPDADVAAGRIPGYVGAVRIRGEIEVRANGTMTVDPDGAPMREDTLFRIASVTKPIGGALTFSLIEDGLFGLDDPVEQWLPEFAELRVLVAPDAPLDQTTGLVRPVTIRHLLTCTTGWGAVMEPTPLQAALMNAHVFPGPFTPPMSGDEYIATLAKIPLAFQPGDGWLYDTPIDALGILVARATGEPLSTLFEERVTGPFGMTSTGFWSAEVDRISTAYVPKDDGLEVVDPPDGAFSRPPSFEEMSSGLLSTAGDLLRFFSGMADGGMPLLSRESLAVMTSDALDDEQRRQGGPILGPGASWAYATGVDIAAAEPGMTVGRWGWDGGTGTTARVNPVLDTVAVLLTQRLMTGPTDGFGPFHAAVAKAAGG